MRTLLLVALLLGGACNPVLSPDVPNSLTGTWTVQMSFQVIRVRWDYSWGPHITETLTCTGQTIWYLAEQGTGPLGPNGTESGALPCLGWTSAMDMNGELWRQEGDYISISKWKHGYFTEQSTCITYFGSYGNMRSATTASGKVVGDCQVGGGWDGKAGWHWTSEGTWSATRK